MRYFGQFAKLVTGEVCVVLCTAPKKRQATLGTRRLDKKGGYATLSIYADALVFTEGSVHTALCTGTQKDPWWYGHWEGSEEGPWVSFDVAFPSVAEEVSKITKPTKSFLWPKDMKI
jgi:hypothetical protein